jgi:dihydroneopterin aldolase
MTASRILIRGIHAEGRHGANPGESEDLQEFVVDLDVDVETAGDALDATVDYRVLVGAALEAVESTSVVLLETLAQTIARAVHRISGVSRVTVRVHKPRAADSLTVDDIAAEVTSE